MSVFQLELVKESISSVNSLARRKETRVARQVSCGRCTGGRFRRPVRGFSIRRSFILREGRLR